MKKEKTIKLPRKLKAPSSKLKASAGFALLFAILASGVLLSISVSIWSLAFREVTLSSFGRESQLAFYAADSGLECALYWDILYNTFATSTGPTIINCGGNQNFSVGGGGDVNPISYIGDINDLSNDLRLGGSAAGPCVLVAITKEYSGTTLVTNAKAYGHNTCDLSNPTRVERGILVTY